MSQVVIFTTSWPREGATYAGRFVSDAADELRGRGIDVTVVRPGVYNDHGLAYGGGMVHNIKRRPWRVPFMLASMVRTLRTHARTADLVHAHWLAGAVVARFSGKPFVVTLHGSGTAGARFQDIGIAQHHPRLLRWLLRPARAVICVSAPLADAIRAAGVQNVHAIPNGIYLPDTATLGCEDAEAFVLFAGRLSPEKGIAELVTATEGMRLVVAGDGPLRDLVPDALGMVEYAELQQLYVRAAVVVLASHREGLPLTLIEAMAHGRPVVATRVGGIPALIDDGVTGLLVDAGDVPALRIALQRLLADDDLRERMGAAARTHIEQTCSWSIVTDRTLGVYAAIGVAAGALPSP